MPDIPSVLISAYAPYDLVTEFRQRAARAERSLSAELRLAMRAHLANDDAPAGQDEGAENTAGRGRDVARI